MNTCYSKLRQEIPHRDRRCDAAALDDHAGSSVSPEDEAGRADTARDVLRALDALPLHLRVPVVLRYYAGLAERESPSPSDVGQEPSSHGCTRPGAFWPRTRGSRILAGQLAGDGEEVRR